MSEPGLSVQSPLRERHRRRVAKGFTLSLVAHEMLRTLADENGISRSRQLEMLIRAEYRRAKRRKQERPPSRAR